MCTEVVPKMAYGVDHGPILDLRHGNHFLIAGDWRPRFHPWPRSSGDSIPPCFNQFLGASRVSPGCQYGFTTFHLPVVVVGPDACIYIYTALNVGRFGHSIHRLSGRDLVVKPMLD